MAEPPGYRLQDLRQLPKLRDSLSYLYVEHCRLDREAHSVALHTAEGVTRVPAASLCLLMLGPGTRVTHAAVAALADNNCLVAWCGEQGVRFYAHGCGGSRSTAALLRQAALVSDPSRRLEVAKRMYFLRFEEELDPALTLEQLRGYEGRRVRDAYERASREFGVPWHGRSYDRGDWRAADPVNRALSAANSCLYGLCHAATLFLGLSPGLGFIHTGKQLSFVYDLGDLYKTEVTVPAAFRVAAQHESGELQMPLERAVRLACRDQFRDCKLLERLSEDIPRVLGVDLEEAEALFAADPAAPGGLWDPETLERVEGGVNYGAGADPGAGLGGSQG